MICALLQQHLFTWTALPLANYTALENLPILAPQLRLLWRQLVSHDNRTMAVSIRLPFDPYSEHGARWLEAMRALPGHEEAHEGLYKFLPTMEKLKAKYAAKQ